MALRAWNHQAQESGFRSFGRRFRVDGSGFRPGGVRRGTPLRGKNRSSGTSWEQGYYQGLLQAMGKGAGRASSRPHGKGMGKSRRPVKSLYGKSAGKGPRVLSKFDKPKFLGGSGLRGFSRDATRNWLEKNSGREALTRILAKGFCQSGRWVETVRKDAGCLAKTAGKGRSRRVVSKFTKPRAVGGLTMQGGSKGGRGGGRRLGKGKGKGKGKTGKKGMVTEAGLDKDLAGYFGISAKEQEKRSGAATKLDIELDKYMSQV